MPAPLFVNALEVGVAQEPATARKTNLRQPGYPRFLVHRNIFVHGRSPEQTPCDHADKSVRATRSRDTIFAK